MLIPAGRICTASPVKSAFMRSKLFVPGSRPELFAKALASAADAISIDLEDAVDPSRKAEAREAIRTFLASPAAAASNKLLIVRVNALATPYFEDDVRAVVSPRLNLLNLPKPESADDVRAAVVALARAEKACGMDASIGILANIESPRGLRCASEIATADARVLGLQLGFGDLLEPLAIDRYNAAAIQQLQLDVRLAAGEAGIWAYDAAWAAIKDPDGYRREAEAARRLGYIGKSCIHPSQIALANDVFRPSDEDIATAVRVLDAWHRAEKDGVGAIMVDGRMIDAPFAQRAAAIVALARQFGLLRTQ
jgi:citrate lyase subunit beta/citryl-CoA lyase